VCGSPPIVWIIHDGCSWKLSATLIAHCVTSVAAVEKIKAGVPRVFGGTRLRGAIFKNMLATLMLMAAIQTAQPQIAHPGFWGSLWQSPSPWVGGIIGALVTGGVFGYVAYLRTLRPTLIFFREQEREGRRVWQLKNVGVGVATYVRIFDYAADKMTVAHSVRTYPMAPGEKRELVWLRAGHRLEARYTDLYGRREYQTTCDGNENEIHRKWRHWYWPWFPRPKAKDVASYQLEIDAIKDFNEKNDKTSPTV
jgi:hypothetical protein